MIAMAEGLNSSNFSCNSSWSEATINSERTTSCRQRLGQALSVRASENNRVGVAANDDSGNDDPDHHP